MDSFKIYSKNDVLALTSQREGEKKLGERVLMVSDLDEIINSSAKFVLLGIPEDIGVRANLGIGGAKTAWQAALKAILNTQSNSFLSGEEILVLGHFEIKEPTDQSLIGLRKKVSEIDDLVCPIIKQIIAAGKIPIVIGGGHNSAFPIIWGTSLAYNQKINVVNIDAHADLRDTAEGRHSGNGFSAALEKGFLGNYRMFGLHENYISENLLERIQNPEMEAFSFEEILQNDKSIIAQWLAMVTDLPNPCGLEIDLDSISNILSSAISPTGLALKDVRRILLNNQKQFSYLHICEGATKLADGREDLTTGKTIAYLVTDFIKARQPRISQQP